jgi:hypothetical protein
MKNLEETIMRGDPRDAESSRIKVSPKLLLRSAYGTNACTCAAIEAKFRIDGVLAVIGNRDSTYGAFRLASTATDTGVVVDGISHYSYLHILSDFDDITLLF